MKAQIWTTAEVEYLLKMLRAGHPAVEMAKLLGRTEASVRYKLLSLGFSSRRVFEAEENIPSSEPPFPEELEVATDVILVQAKEELERSESRRAIRDLINEEKFHLVEKALISELRAKLLDLPLRIEVPALPSPASGKQPARDSAVLVLSDCHIGQVVDPLELDSVSGYNPAVFLRRLALLETSVQEILQSHPVKELIVLLAGDIVHGRLGHSLEDDLTLPIATQVDLALHCLAHLIGRLAAQVPRMEVHTVAGNHGRWPGTKKVPTDRRWSNLDTILSQALQALCEATLKNVRFDERISSRRIIDVADYRILLLHGDQLRGGTYASNGIQKEISRWLLRSVQNGQRPPDLLVAGDKHISAALPLGFAEAIINGSFVGEDVFSQNFNPSPPSQTMFFVRPGIGRTQTHVLRLDKGAPDGPLPYDLKPALQALAESFERENCTPH